MDSSAPTPAPAAPAPQATTPQAAPGKTLGIVGFILAIVIPLVGLILSIVALVQSKKAHVANGLALAGVIIGAIFTGISIIVFTLITIVAYNGVSTAAHGAALCSQQGDTGTVMVGNSMYDCDTHSITSM